MDPHLFSFLVRKIVAPVAIVLLVLLLMAGMVIWEKIKAKWHERKPE